MVYFAFSAVFKAGLDFSALSSTIVTLGYPIKMPSSYCSFLEILSDVELKTSVKQLDFGSTSNIVKLSGQAH